MRREQDEAVNKTHAYFHSIWEEDMNAVPRFLWNAKMRFGKTFTTYQLAKKLGCQTRARGDVQARGRGCVADRSRIPCRLRRLAVSRPATPAAIRRKSISKKPVVYFGSFQDLLGRDERQHQAQERVAPRGELGSRGLR